MSTVPADPNAIEYPDTDGLPMAESTRQFEWIVVVKLGVDGLYAARTDVFVAGDLFWYPVEGRPDIRTAPDTLVVFGRPKGHRGSYRQWEEDGIAPQVVFEILSPSNTKAEMDRKRDFYDRYRVDEYYIYDPEAWEFEGWVRDGDDLVRIEQTHGWKSPLLGIRFDLSGTDLVIHRPDGRRFRTYQELAESEDEAIQQIADAHALAEQERERAERAAERAARLEGVALAERQRADQEKQRAEQAIHLVDAEKQRAEQEKHRAEQEKHRADREAQTALEERQRAEALQRQTELLMARLRAAGLDPADASKP